MIMNDKKSLLICCGLFILTLLFGLGCYYIALLFVDKDDVIVDIGEGNNLNDDGNNNQDVINDNNDLITNLVKITLNNDDYLWKMKVVNMNGA